MATRGRHSVGITSDGTDAEYRQKVAGHYKQSASARKTLRLLLPADVVLGVALAALRARPVVLAPDPDYILMTAFAVIVAVQCMAFGASFKTRSAAAVGASAIGSLLSGAAIIADATLRPQALSVLDKGVSIGTGIVHVVVAFVCLQLSRAFASAASTKKST